MKFILLSALIATAPVFAENYCKVSLFEMIPKGPGKNIIQEIASGSLITLDSRFGSMSTEYLSYDNALKGRETVVVQSLFAPYVTPEFKDFKYVFDFYQYSLEEQKEVLTGSIQQNDLPQNLSIKLNNNLIGMVNCFSLNL